MTDGDPAATDPAGWVARAEQVDAAPADVRAALDRLLALDPATGASTALGLLARSPRIKPSSGLVVDPGDTVLRRWRQRVEACRALLASPALAGVVDEVRDELTDSATFAGDVLADVVISAALPEHHRAALLALAPAR